MCCMNSINTGDLHLMTTHLVTVQTYKSTDQMVPVISPRTYDYYSVPAVT